MDLLEYKNKTYQGRGGGKDCPQVIVIKKQAEIKEAEIKPHHKPLFDPKK